MPTRTSMRQLSNIWTNPYGGTPQNELNQEIADDTTRYRLSLAAEERARLENDLLSEQVRAAREKRPENIRYTKAEDMNYDVGLFNSPLGYQNRQKLDTEAADVARRLRPQWEFEVQKAGEPWRQRGAIQALENEGDLAVQLAKNSGAMSVAERKAAENLMARYIMGQFAERTARERALGGIAEAGVNTSRDVPAAMREYTNAPRPKQTTWDKLQAYVQKEQARGNPISLRDAWDMAIAEGWEVK